MIPLKTIINGFSDGTSFECRQVAAARMHPRNLYRDRDGRVFAAALTDARDAANAYNVCAMLVQGVGGDQAGNRQTDPKNFGSDMIGHRLLFGGPVNKEDEQEFMLMTPKWVLSAWQDTMHLDAGGLNWIGTLNSSRGAVRSGCITQADLDLLPAEQATGWKLALMEFGSVWRYCDIPVMFCQVSANCHRFLSLQFGNVLTTLGSWGALKGLTAVANAAHRSSRRTAEDHQMHFTSMTTEHERWMATRETCLILTGEDPQEGDIQRIFDSLKYVGSSITSIFGSHEV